MNDRMVDFGGAADKLLARDKAFCRLIDLLKQSPKLAIAFSGGADSAFLLAAARIANVASVLPVTIISDFFTSLEKERVIRLGQDLGLVPVLVPVHILEDDKITRNTKLRCYFCKTLLFSRVMETAKGHGIHTLLHGANLDDLQQFRPGMDAARELGFKAPLVEAGFTKHKIRECSKVLGLETWGLPAQSCLATRIPTGQSITKEKLVRVERAESCLHGLGFGQVRVRCHGDLARIEAPPDQLNRFLEDAIRQEVILVFKQIGFFAVCLDMQGYGQAAAPRKA